MAAKRKIAPPKPNLDRPWSELTKAQQNKLYTKALHAYTTGNGPNPTTSTAFAREENGRRSQKLAGSVRSLRIALATALLAFETGAPAVAQNDRGPIAALLAQSVRAWNHGDLDTFMRGYEDSPATTYVSSKTVIHGYAAIRAHYAAHYGTSGMPALSISDLDVRPLGAAYAVAVARWHLAMSNTTNAARPTGIFTLVLHRSGGVWRIVTDHSP